MSLRETSLWEVLLEVKVRAAALVAAVKGEEGAAAVVFAWALVVLAFVRLAAIRCPISRESPALKLSVPNAGP
jgi:hypothetical protein